MVRWIRGLYMYADAPGVSVYMWYAYTQFPLFEVTPVIYMQTILLYDELS